MRRLLKRLALGLLTFCVILCILYVCRVSLLIGLANAWVVNEPVTKADAIVILGGGVENRPFAAAKLFHAGVAPVILFMDVKLNPAQEIGVYPSEKEQTRQILLHREVPDSSLFAIGTNVASTFDESRAVRDWARQTGATSIVITTDLFHTRRARWIFRREFRDTTVKIHVVAVEPVRYKINGWWRNEDGLIQFQNEVVKSVYYWAKY